MVTCAKCSHWKNGKRIQVQHKTVAQVKLCHMKGQKTSG